MGPSPRIRGECMGFSQVQAGYGTIPANTGRICASATAIIRLRDHPREYGENIQSAIRSSACVGPSPRIRGECHPPWGAPPEWGTIPANTGRITRSAGAVLPRRDHPREYGENINGLLQSRSTQGPSPRIRGESVGVAGLCQPIRTIPANTGRILADLRKPDQQD